MRSALVPVVRRTTSSILSRRQTIARPLSLARKFTALHRNRQFSSLIPNSNNDNKEDPSSSSELASGAPAAALVPINFDTSSSIQGEESQILQVVYSNLTKSYGQKVVP
jgi:hypothetical protein